MEVGLPAHQVVLVDPAHVPYAGAGQGDGGITGPLGAQPVLRVVPLDEHRQRQADGPYRLGRDQTGPPAVVVDVGAAVQPGRGPQRLGREVMAELALAAGEGGLDPPGVDDLSEGVQHASVVEIERKSTRLNSSHVAISYAV